MQLDAYSGLIDGLNLPSPAFTLVFVAFLSYHFQITLDNLFFGAAIVMAVAHVCSKWSKVENDNDDRSVFIAVFLKLLEC